jgi:hypothetical protein
MRSVPKLRIRKAGENATKLPSASSTAASKLQRSSMNSRYALIASNGYLTRTGVTAYGAVADAFPDVEKYARAGVSRKSGVWDDAVEAVMGTKELGPEHPKVRGIVKGLNKVYKEQGQIEGIRELEAIRLT